MPAKYCLIGIEPSGRMQWLDSGPLAALLKLRDAMAGEWPHTIILSQIDP